MMAWAFDNDAPRLWEPHTGPMPKEVSEAMISDVRKIAWNASFERYICWYVLNLKIPTNQFDDAMVWARHLSLPGHLVAAGSAIGLPFDQLKNQDGKRLINKFSKPYHKGGEETLFGITEPRFHNWEDEPEDWKRFGEYCLQDVVSERAILNVVSHIPLPEQEYRAWLLDQKINDTGIPINRGFVERALALSLEARKRLVKDLTEITKLENPSSRNQFLAWAQTRGYPFLSLGKDFVKKALAEDSGINTDLRRALKLRQEASKTSYTKFETILDFISPDNRLRHQFSFMGGARTGRWAGKDTQMQNPARPTKDVEQKYEKALKLIESCPLPVTEEYFKKVQSEFPSVMTMTVSCIRSSVQAPPGKKLVVCDLGSIENRVLGWLAGCDAIARVFREGRDAYLDFASKMYLVTYDSLIKIVEGVHKANGPDASAKRQVAKPAVLGAGYGLGPGARKNPDGTYEAIIKDDAYGNKVKTGLMGYAENMGVKLTPEQAYLAWETFRKAYPEVVELWKKLEKAAIKVLQTGRAVRVGPLIFSRRARKNGQFILRIQLPSGRGLHYINARVETEIAQRKSDGSDYEKSKLMYDGIGHGVGQIGKGQKWGPVYTYGGKITENVVQAISRDLLSEGMFEADAMNAVIPMHVHDEIVCESDADDPFGFGVSDLKYCMEKSPEWAKDLVLGAEGWEGKFYKK
jgi:DNA polymerase